MVLKLHGSGRSTCTRRVGAVLVEKKIPFELIEVDILGKEHKSEEYRKIQPFGMIPYIDDDGFILYESRAICRYIEEKWHNKGPKLIPDELKAKALFEQAASVEQNNFDPYASAAVNENVFKPHWGLTPDPKAYEKFIADLGEKLNGYEQILSKRKYLAGDEITLANFFHLPYGSMLEKAGSNIMFDESRPNVVRWWKEITTRESWQSVKDGNLKFPA